MEKFVIIDNIKYEVWYNSLTSEEIYPVKGDIRIIEGLMFYVSCVHREKSFTNKRKSIHWELYIPSFMSQKNIDLVKSQFDKVFR